MQPEIDIGPLTLQTFGLMLGLGFVAAGWLIAKRLKELGKSPDVAYELVFAALIGGVIGAKLWYVIEEGDLGELFSGVGLVWYGGLLGGAAGVLLWARHRDMLDARLLDLVAPGLALGYAVGRIGCQLAGDGDYGIPSDLPWAMAYPNGTVPTTDEVHPTPVYETLAMAGLAFALWQLRDKLKPSGLFALYLLGSGLERFLVEFVRRNEEVALGLSAAQFFALVLVAAGAIWLWRLWPLRLAPVGAGGSARAARARA
jgi:phosphatidylglycerol:prolipoprotein diacylglycerol transferase